MAYTFKCPPMPPALREAAWREGRLDETRNGHRVTREWFWRRLAEHQAATARAREDNRDET